MSPRAGLYAVEKRKIPNFPPGIEHPSVSGVFLCIRAPLRLGSAVTRLQLLNACTNRCPLRTALLEKMIVA